MGQARAGHVGLGASAFTGMRGFPVLRNHAYVQTRGSRLRGSHPSRDLASQREHEAHGFVRLIGGWLEHQRTAAVDHGNAILPPVFRGDLRNAAGADGAVHPDVVNAQIYTLAHGGIGSLRLSADYNRIDTAGDRPQVGIAGIALDMVRIRVTANTS